jgi:hypothetical protein
MDPSTSTTGCWVLMLYNTKLYFTQCIMYEYILEISFCIKHNDRYAVCATLSS